MQALLHVNKLLNLALDELADRNTCPFAHYAGDRFVVDLFVQHLTLGLRGRKLRCGLDEVPLRGGDVVVLDSAGQLELSGPSRAIEIDAQRLGLLLEILDPRHGLFLAHPLGSERGALLVQRRQLFLDGRETFACILLFGDHGPLDLELHDALLDVLQFRRQAVDLDAQLGGCLIDEVDGLVRQKPVGDVAVR